MQTKLLRHFEALEPRAVLNGDMGGALLDLSLALHHDVGAGAHANTSAMVDATALTAARVNTALPAVNNAVDRVFDEIGRIGLTSNGATSSNANTGVSNTPESNAGASNSSLGSFVDPDYFRERFGRVAGPEPIPGI